MWLFLLTVRYSCVYASYSGLSGFGAWDVPVCHAFVPVNGIIRPEVLYFGSCYTDGKHRKFVFDFCECRIPKEGESYTYKLDSWDRAIFCYNLTDTTQPTSTPKPTRTPQATKTKNLPECSHYKKPRTTLAVLSKFIFVA